MSKPIKRLITLVLCGGLLAVWLVMCVRVNLENPPVPRQVYREGERFLYDTREVTLIDSQILSGEETKAVLAAVNPGWYREIIETYDNERIRMLTIHLCVKNTGDTPYEGALNGLIGLMCTKTDTLSYLGREECEVLNQQKYGDEWATLQAGEERIYTLVGLLDSSWMSPAYWSRIDDTDFEILLKGYPVEIVLSTEEEIA